MGTQMDADLQDKKYVKEKTRSYMRPEASGFLSFSGLICVYL
jgi:hypothetical protein